MEEKKEQRPLILEIDDAKMEIVQAINNALNVHKLPCYIVDMILTDVHSQVKDGAKSELEMTKKQVKGEEVA
jgi:hypothetical protein